VKYLRIVLLFACNLLLIPAQAGEEMAASVPIAAPEVIPEVAPEVTPAAIPEATPAIAPETSMADSVPPPKPPAILPGREGYAFGKPEILVRQRLFGLAHGVSLLAATCLDLPEHSVPIQHAYAAWHALHAQAIATIVQDLAGYYFGEQAAAAQWPDLVRALKLKENINAALGDFELSAACATLPQAMEGPRYDLTALLQDDPVTAIAVLSGIPAANAANATPAAPAAPAVPAPAPLTPAPVTQESPAPYAPFPHR
jgi:hypothetical protein